MKITVSLTCAKHHGRSKEALSYNPFPMFNSIFLIKITTMQSCPSLQFYRMIEKSESVSRSVVSDSLQPMDLAHQDLCPWLCTARSFPQFWIFWKWNHMYSVSGFFHSILCFQLKIHLVCMRLQLFHFCCCKILCFMNISHFIYPSYCWIFGLSLN